MALGGGARSQEEISCSLGNFPEEVCGITILDIFSVGKIRWESCSGKAHQPLLLEYCPELLRSTLGLSPVYYRVRHPQRSGAWVSVINCKASAMAFRVSSMAARYAVHRSVDMPFLVLLVVVVDDPCALACAHRDFE